MSATNGLGWVVQQYIRENGWTAVTNPYPTPEEAESVRVAQFPESMATRVYEALDHPKEQRIP